MMTRRNMQWWIPLSLALCLVPELVHAAEPESDEAAAAEPPWTALNELAIEARATCRDLENFDANDPKTYLSWFPRPPDTSKMKAKDKAEAESEYAERLKAPIDAAGNVQLQCSNYCSSSASVLDLCALEAPSLAAVAVVVAGDEVSNATQELERIVKPIEKAKAELAGEPAPPHAPAAAGAGVSWIATALGLGSGTTTDLATGLAAALAKFVLKRAQRESLSWAMDRMAKDVCTKDVGKPWFPHFCVLAGDQRLGSVASGAALLEALQGALREDARSWPGIMVGTELGAGDDVTKAAERAFGRIMRANNPALALHGLGLELAANSKVSGCGLELPAAFLQYRGLLESLATPDPATMLAAVIGTPDCFEAVGSSDPTFPKIHRALEISQHDAQLRKSTVLGAALVAAQREYDKAMAATPAGGSEDEGEAETTVAEGEDSDDANKPDLVVTRRQSAAVALYGSAIEFARSNVSILEAANSSLKADVEAFKTKLDAFDKVAKLLDAELNERWGEAVAVLARYLDEKHADEIKALDDEIKALNDAMTPAGRKPTEAEEQKQGEIETQAKTTKRHADALIGRLGTVAALLTAGDDGKQLEDTLHAVARPAGGWRSKAKPGNWTLSLTSFPGLYTAAEWRWGPYGAVVETGKVYAQAPTLAMPIGLDITNGAKRKNPERCTVVWGFFVSVIDPAAFLGYDVNNAGKLPGPRLTTAVSPGLAFRLTIPRSPFALLFWSNFRPQYRTWKATVDGPGANVVQVGLNLAVDVTIWTITSGGKRK